MSSIVSFVPLKELGEIVSGSTPDTSTKAYWDGDIHWITPADLTAHAGIYFIGRLRKITKSGYNSCSTKLLPPGSILFSSRAPIGHCAVTTFPLCTNQGFKSIIPNKKLDSIYGFFALKFFTPKIVALGRGATFSEINKDIFENFCIPLPSLRKQKRIATILAKADRLRRLRRYALELSGTYLQSVFLEMFGDPKTNPKGWDLKTLGDVIYSAQDGPHVSPDYSEAGVPFLSTRNIRSGVVVWEDLKFISREEAEKHWQKCKPQRGDILYTKGGTTGLAKAIDFDREIAVWVHIALLKPDNKLVDSLWLESMLNSDFCYNQSQEFTHGIANHDLGLTRMVKIKLYLPPLSLQSEFTRIAKKYTRLLAQQIEAERQAEHLFQTLLHKAFRGELSLDEDEMLMPDVEIVNQRMPAVADVIEPIDMGAFQMALPME